MVRWTSSNAVIVYAGASSVVRTSLSSTRSYNKGKGVLLPSTDPVHVTISSVGVPDVSTIVSLVRSSKKKTKAPVTPSTPSIAFSAVVSSTYSVGGRIASSLREKKRIQRSRASLSKTSTAGVVATSSLTSPHFSSVE